MKRIISIIIFVLLLSGMGVHAAVPFPWEPLTDNSAQGRIASMQAALDAIGIITGSDAVTRGGFVRGVVSLLNVEAETFDGAAVFPDVSSTSPYAKHIALAYSLGIVTGTGQGFDAESYVTGLW